MNWSIFWPPRTPPWAIQLLQQQQSIIDGVNKIMAAVQVDQTALDSLASSLQAVATVFASEIQDLETKLAAALAANQPLPAGSLDGLNSALTALQALETPTPTP